MTYTGSLWTLLNPYGLIGGLATIAAFALNGAIFLSLKIGGGLEEKAEQATRRLWLPTVIFVAALLVATYFYTDIIAHLGIGLGVMPVISLVALLLVGYFLNRRRNGWAFALMGALLPSCWFPVS